MKQNAQHCARNCYANTHLSRGCTNIWKIFVLTDQIEETAHEEPLQRKGIKMIMDADNICANSLLDHYVY